MIAPEVSVIVCTHDRPQQLVRCLKSLFELNYDSFEIIVVDSASENFSVPPMNYSLHTRFFSLPVPGLSFARNLGVRKAQGRFVAFIDDDAVADREWLKSAVRNFEQPAVACVTGRVLPLEIKTEWQEKLSSWHPNSVEPKMFSLSNFDPLALSPGAGGNFFVRRSFFDDHEFSIVLGAGTPVGGDEENYLFHQMVRAGWNILYEPDAIVYHDNPSTKEQYKRRIITYNTSRGAYLIKLLISEKGWRLVTLKHIVGSLFLSRKRSDGTSTGLKAVGFLRSPFALLASMLLAYKNRSFASKDVLVAEFYGEADPSELR